MVICKWSNINISKVSDARDVLVHVLSYDISLLMSLP